MVKQGDKVRSLVSKLDIKAGCEYKVSVAEERNDSVVVADDAGGFAKLWRDQYVPIEAVVAPTITTPLQYFTTDALVEAVSKAIDAGDTQSARAIIDAMEEK